MTAISSKIDLELFGWLEKYWNQLSISVTLATLFFVEIVSKSEWKCDWNFDTNRISPTGSVENFEIRTALTI